MTLLQTIIIAIVEGLTEFLPVSSTGHMLIAENLLGVQNSAFVRAFTIIIQFAAILSVVVLYWNRFFRLDHSPAPAGSTTWQKIKHKWYFYWILIVAFIPTGVVGLVVKKSGMIDFMLNPANAIWIVPVMLVIGGIFMLFCDRIFNKGREENKVTERRAFWIGLIQCFSMIPGTSRSMATIVGGMCQAPHVAVPQSSRSSSQCLRWQQPQVSTSSSSSSVMMPWVGAGQRPITLSCLPWDVS